MKNTPDYPLEVEPMLARMRTVTAMLALSLALLLPGDASDLRAQAPPRPFVIVQAVDPAWLPLPGAVVHLRERGGARTAYKATTNADGFASFQFDPPEAEQSYALSVTMAGFKDAEMKNVRFGSCSGGCRSSRYIQLQLLVAGPAFTIR